MGWKEWAGVLGQASKAELGDLDEWVGVPSRNELPGVLDWAT